MFIAKFVKARRDPLSSCGDVMYDTIGADDWKGVDRIRGRLRCNGLDFTGSEGSCMARRMFILKECNALWRRKGCLDSSGSGKLERLAEIAIFNKFSTSTLEGLRRWVRWMLSEAVAKCELVPVITEEVGHDCRGRDGLGVGEKEMRKA